MQYLSGCAPGNGQSYMREKRSAKDGHHSLPRSRYGLNIVQKLLPPNFAAQLWPSRHSLLHWIARRGAVQKLPPPNFGAQLRPSRHSLLYWIAPPWCCAEAASAKFRSVALALATFSALLDRARARAGAWSAEDKLKVTGSTVLLEVHRFHFERRMDSLAI